MKNVLVKFYLFFVFLTLIFLFAGKSVYAVTEDECKQKTDTTEKITCLETLLTENSQKKNSLQSEIQRFNTQISLTSTQIIQSGQQIALIEQQITDLLGKINRLDVSLDQLSGILVKRIAATYKKGSIDSLSLFLSSQGFGDFINRYKYLRMIQLNDRRIMVQMETTRTSYDDQRLLKEQKQKELETAKQKLESQSRLLAQQKKAKEDFLAVTQNDEKRYRQLLEEANAQLRSLKGFTSKQAGGILPPQNSPDGWFFSQRDERWASKTIGLSSDDIYDVGCLVSSVAMIFKFYGQNVTPIDIANNYSNFFSNTAYMLEPWPSPPGKSYTKIGLDDMDKELGEGRPVIVHLRLGGDGHFIVIKKKEGDSYLIHDPWQGYDKNFKDFYSVGLIDKVVVFR